MIIFSEELLSHPYILQNTLDVYIRDHEMRRNIRLFVSKKNAEAILKQSAKPENLPAQYIDMLAEHPPKNTQMIEAARIGEVQEKMISNRSFVLPILELTKQGVQMNGAALFRGKDNKCVGNLSGEETLGMNYIIGKNWRFLRFVKINLLHMKFISCVEKLKYLQRMLQNQSLIFIYLWKAHWLSCISVIIKGFE